MQPSHSDNIEELEVIPFKFKHYPLLMEMLKDREYPEINRIVYRELPKIGYICLLGKQPVAAGFLRRVEGNVLAIMDTFASNPYFGSIIRHQGLNKIVDALIEDAKTLKLKGVMAFTVHKDILLRTEAIGFKQVNCATVVLSFEEIL